MQNLFLIKMDPYLSRIPHCGPATVAAASGAIGELFFQAADYSYVCKALSGFDPRPPVCCVGEAAFPKDQKARWLGDGF